MWSDGLVHPLLPIPRLYHRHICINYDKLCLLELDVLYI